MFGNEGIGCIDVKDRQVEGHFGQDAQSTLLCDLNHQGLIGRVFHFSAGIKDQGGIRMARVIDKRPV